MTGSRPKRRNAPKTATQENRSGNRGVELMRELVAQLVREVGPSEDVMPALIAGHVEGARLIAAVTGDEACANYLEAIAAVLRAGRQPDHHLADMIPMGRA
jgi:primosomal protein N'